MSEAAEDWGEQRREVANGQNLPLWESQPGLIEAERKADGDRAPGIEWPSVTWTLTRGGAGQCWTRPGQGVDRDIYPGQASIKLLQVVRWPGLLLFFSCISVWPGRKHGSSECPTFLLRSEMPVHVLQARRPIPVESMIMKHRRADRAAHLSFDNGMWPASCPWNLRECQ